jgi:hypothetical protein
MDLFGWFASDFIHLKINNKYIHHHKGKVHSRTGRTKDQKEIDVYLYPSLTSALDGVGGHGHDPAALTLFYWERPRTHCIIDWEVQRPV